MPAHRVVNRLGWLSGAAHFPPEAPMQAQLESEGVKVINDQVVDFERFFWDPWDALELDENDDL